MKYQVLFLDLDGTTIQNNINAYPSRKVTDAIYRAQKLIKIAIATGRPLYKAKYLIDHLKLTAPCVVGGGTQVYDPIGKIVLFEYHFPDRAIPDVAKISRKYGLEIGIFNGETDLPLTDYQSNTKVLGMYLPVVPFDLADVVVSDLKQINGVAVHKMPSWEKGSISIDVCSAIATKLHGIQTVLKILKINKSQVIGVGDSYNDFPLLMASGLKIAMGNAIPELKEIADYIAPSVIDDGVATILEKFILKT